MNINQSPFNVGKQVKLPGFNLEQVLNLAKVYKLDWEENPEQERFSNDLIEMVGGHPYLVDLALKALAAQKISQEKLLVEAPTQGGLYSSHLRRHWDNLQSSPELAEGIKEVVKSDSGVQLEPSVAYKLESMGLINLLGDEAKPSCQLYHRYFADNLLK